MCLPEGERDSEAAMALEAVVYPQDPFAYASKDLCSFLVAGGANWGYDHDDFNLCNKEAEGSFTTFPENQTENYPYNGDWNCSPPPTLPHLSEIHLSNNPYSETTNASNTTPSEPHQNLGTSTSMAYRPKRRRAKSRKNQEEIENQRMTHIAVERNRRKQMNEYLSVLRSLMPESYVQRGDQASIIGGAINFVKELEQRLQFLGGQKETDHGKSNGGASMPFSEFFTFPQYSTSSGSRDSPMGGVGEQVGQVQSGIADVEVTMVESHANLKIRSKKRPKQLLKIVSGLHSLRLTILHLNVTTGGEVVLCSLSVKVEDDCKLSSADEIAAALHQMLERIQQEATLHN